MLRAANLFLILASLVLVHSANAEVYRWVDKNGKVNYSDAPPPDAKVEQRKLKDNSVETDKLPFETKRAMQNAPLTLYTAPDCKEVCDNGRNLLTKRKAPFTEKSVKTKEELDAFLKATGQKEPQVPVLMVGNRTVNGFEAGTWNSALDTAGYPK